MKHNHNVLTSNYRRGIKNILAVFLFAVVMIFSLFSNGSFVSQAMTSSTRTSVGYDAYATASGNVSYVQYSNSTSQPSGNSIAQDITSVMVTSSTSTISSGGQVTVTAKVTDSINSQNTPTSSISWSDGIGGGTFTPSSCTLISGSCTVSYTPSANPPNAITITASYSGDSTHQASTGSSQLSTNVLDPTTLTITPNPATFSFGTQVTFTVTVADTANPSSNMIGLIKWTDNGAGGSFSPDACILAGNHCSLQYIPPSNPSNRITIAASYAGDSTHSGSSTTSVVSENTASSSSSTTPSTQPSTTPTTKSSTTSTSQSSSKNPTQSSETSGNTNPPQQQNPVDEIKQVIKSIVSELKALFKKL